MKKSEIKELALEDLEIRLNEERSTLTNLKFTHAVSALENPNVLRNTRKNIARILTEINVRKQEQTAGSAAETN